MQPVNRGRFPLSGSTGGHPEKLQYTQSRLKNIPDKVGDAWSEAAVALYITILKTRLCGDDPRAITQDVDLKSRKHKGRIHRKTCLLEAFLLQRIWDDVTVKGQQEKWTPANYKVQVDQMVKKFVTGTLVPEWQGMFSMPVEVRAAVIVDQITSKKLPVL